MEIQELTDEVKVTGRNKAGGISVAHLFSSAKTEQAFTVKLVRKPEMP